MFSGYYICKIMVVRWSGKVPLWFSYAISSITTTCLQPGYNHSVVKTTNLFLQYVMSTIQVYLINSNGQIKLKVYIQSENPGTMAGTLK